jgi:hypothetical protein
MAGGKGFRPPSTLRGDGDLRAQTERLIRELQSAVTSLQGRSGTYTPALTAATTNPTLGSGSTQNGYYTALGDLLVVAWFDIRFGTSGVNAGSGNYSISLPFEAHANHGTSFIPSGVVSLFDNSTAANRTQAVPLPVAGDTTATMFADNGSAVSNSNPFTWAASDRIRGFVAYMRAS